MAISDLRDFQFLTLSLRGEKYAIPVGRVLEVLEYAKVTRLPGTATYLKGIINLRGAVIVVVEMAEEELFRDDEMRIPHRGRGGMAAALPCVSARSRPCVLASYALSRRRAGPRTAGPRPEGQDQPRQGCPSADQSVAKAVSNQG